MDSSARASSFPVVRCRVCLLPSGSKERFCCAREVFFITAVRGAQRLIRCGRAIFFRRKDMEALVGVRRFQT
jgi:hypothetical protein